MSSPRETLSVRADQQKKHGRKRRLTVWLLSGGALSLIALFAFGYGLEAYLASRSPMPAVTDLESLVAFNAANAERVMPHFAQEILESSLGRGTLDGAEYRHARQVCLALAARDGIDAGLRDSELVILPEVRHSILVECPELVAGPLLDFLQRRG